MALYSDALIVGSAWLLLGVTTYGIYRRRKGLSLTESAKVSLPVPVGAEPVEYAGIKLFYRWDKPLLTEVEVQTLTPRPNYIQYQ